jgi:hypothetical protein
MTELAEPVAIAFASDEEWECPFSHAKKKPKDVDNVMPPVDGKDTNNSTLLGKNLDAEFAGMEVIPIGLKVGAVTRQVDVQFTPHHVVPGNESWPDTKLLEWVDKAKGTINADIGYDVNDASNGIDLPGIHGLGESGWTGTGPAFQMKYAFAAMANSAPKRQFHDRHNAYSAFVVNVLDAIAEKIEAKGPDAPPGCGNANCGGKKEKPFDPPFGLNTRLDGVAARLKAKLQGFETGWKMPIFTSRFAVMYKMKPMTQDEARIALREARQAIT